MSRFEGQYRPGGWQERIRQLWDYKPFRTYMTWAMILTIAFFLILISKALFFLVIFMSMNIIIGFLFKPFKFVLFGIEFTMLATVTTAIAFGAKVAIIIAIFTIIAKLLFQTSFNPTNILTIVSYIIVAIIAASMSSGLMTVAWSCIIFHVIFTTITYFFMGANPAQIVIFWVTYIPFNLFMLSAAGPWLLGLMG